MENIWDKIEKMLKKKKTMIKKQEKLTIEKRGLSKNNS